MSRAKVFISILMVLILIALSGASVWAAPGGQEEDQDQISGVVTDIVIEVDEEGTTTVLVTLDDTQTVRLSLETAIEYGLVVVTGEDEQGNPVVEVNEGALQQDLTIDPGDVIEYVEEDGEEAEHPVASALAEFIALKLGLDDGLYETIMGYHEEGFGFGVIAQAWWMSFALQENHELLYDILEAKRSRDFSSIELPDGETAKNWGQFKKAVLSSDKAKKNLGYIMSGRAGQDETDGDDLGAAANQGQGKGKKGKGSDEEVGGSSVEPSGKGKSKGGKPETPPGQDKKGGGGKGKGKGKDK